MLRRKSDNFRRKTNGDVARKKSLAYEEKKVVTLRGKSHNFRRKKS